MKPFLKIFTGKTYRFTATFLILGILCTPTIHSRNYSDSINNSITLIPENFLEEKTAEEILSIRLQLEGKLWEGIVDPGQWPNGEQLKPKTLLSVAEGNRRSYDSQGPEGTAYTENGLKPRPYDELDEENINQQIKKLAQLFVKDVGPLCNDKILNSFEGLESLKRIWLNRYDHELAAEQQKRFYKIQAKIKPHEFPENPALLLGLSLGKA